MPEKPYRKNVGALLRRSDGLILMAERLREPGAWQFPQGGVDDGEGLEDALWRELEEELGLSPARELCRLVGHGPEVTYDFPAGSAFKLARKYKGQAQTLFLLDFLGTDADFDLAASDHPEFGAVRWVHPQDALHLLWEPKRPSLEATLKALAAHL